MASTCLSRYKSAIRRDTSTRFHVRRNYHPVGLIFRSFNWTIPQLLARRLDVLCADTQYILVCVCGERKRKREEVGEKALLKPMAPIGWSMKLRAAVCIAAPWKESPFRWRHEGNSPWKWQPGYWIFAVAPSWCTSWITTGRDFSTARFNTQLRKKLGRKDGYMYRRMNGTGSWKGF